MMKKYFYLTLAASFSAIAQNYHSYMNVGHKEQDAKVLVKSAVKYISDTSLNQAIDAFLEDPSWRKGDLALSILNSKGIIILDTQESLNIWTQTDNHPSIKTAAKEGGGWVQSIRNDRIFSSYVEKIEKEGETYYVQVGFFSFSPEADTLHTVNVIYDYFHKNGLNATIKAINNSEFERRGLLFPHLCDMEGRCIAYEAHSHQVGKKMYEGEDIEGRPLMKVILDLLNSPEQGGWATHVWTDAIKKIYVKRLDENYFACAGFFPELGKDDAINLVQKGAAFLISNGPKMALPEFANLKGIFIKGYLSITVLDTKGKVIVSPYNPEWVGEHLKDEQDERGHPFVKRILDKVEVDDTALVFFAQHNRNWTVYAKKVETPEGTYILTCGFFPFDKEVAVKTITGQAIDFFERNSPAEAFKEFSKKDGLFYSGDLSIFVYDMLGNCMVNGPHTDFIWENFFNFQDQTGRRMVADMINAAQLDDEAWLTFKTNNDTRRVFVSHIYESLPSEEENLEIYRSYILGCGYYI